MTKIVALAVALSALATAAWAEEPAQFDLVCKGSITTTSKAGSHSNLETDVYHIDLINHQWCMEKCTIVRTIISVTPGLLMIQKANLSMSTGSTSFSMHGSTKFDRKTSTLIMDMTMGNSVTKGEMPCAIKPFTPFPADVNYG